MKHIELLKERQACREAIEWCKQYKTLAACWRYCQRADWLLWFAGEVGVEKRLLVLAACDCAETTLKYIDNKECKQAAETAIRVTRAWCDGKVTLDKVSAAAHAAVHADTHAASAAAYTAYAGYAAHAAADAADTAYAAHAAHADAHAAMRKLVKKYIHWQDIKTAAKKNGIII